ncbi:MAG: prenyltransferase/squalene oxidase repeat-containing protein [Solirubrobacteraceae bacterium]
MTRADRSPAGGRIARRVAAGAALGVLALAAAPTGGGMPLPGGTPVPGITAASAQSSGIGSDGRKQLDTTVAYLQRAQNEDGGFPRLRAGASSHVATSVWVGLAVASAGINPRRQTLKGGRTLWAYLDRHAGELRRTGDISRAVQVAVAAGEDPQTVGGEDLVAKVLARQAADGSFADRGGGGASVEATAWALLALARSPTSEAVKAARDKGRDWLISVRQKGESWGATPGGTPTTTATALVVQALAVSKADDLYLDTAVAWIGDRQHNSSGGFADRRGGSPDLLATVFALQAIRAAAGNPLNYASGGRNPLQYVQAQQRSSGAVGSSSIMRTAQATPGLAYRTFPLKPVKDGKATNGEPADSKGPANDDGGDGDVNSGGGNSSGADNFSQPTGGGGQTAGGTADGDTDATGGPQGTGGETRTGLSASNGDSDRGQSDDATTDDETSGAGDEPQTSTTPDPSGAPTGDGNVSGTVVGQSEAASGDPNANGGAAPSLAAAGGQRDTGGATAGLGGAALALGLLGVALEARRPRGGRGPLA